jgi:hypothetical protein
MKLITITPRKRLKTTVFGHPVVRVPPAVPSFAEDDDEPKTDRHMRTIVGPIAMPKLPAMRVNAAGVPYEWGMPDLVITGVDVPDIKPCMCARPMTGIFYNPTGRCIACGGGYTR